MRFATLPTLAGRVLQANATAGWPVRVTIVLAFAIGCSDSPAAVGHPDATPALSAEPSQAAAVAAGDIVDPMTPRLDLDIEVLGSLAPHAQVVLRLEATAREAITGGTVELVLPTMAGMAHNGPDKRPRFPPSRKMPTIGSWVLTQLSKGDTWKEQVTMRLPEKGYYQVAVDIRARGPDPSGLGPRLLDEGYRQAWMFVTEGGGVLTPEFDASVFPDRIAPQPGPFQVRPGQRAKAQQSAGVAASSSRSVYLEAVYYSNGRYLPAAGGDITGRTYSQTDTSRTRTVRRVPASGVVAFACPSASEYWQGGMGLPGTRYARGTWGAQYWSASSSQCGDTVQVVVSAPRYVAWTYVNEVIPRINSFIGFSRSVVNWDVDLRTSNLVFQPRHDRIVLGGAWNKWTVGHEYMHALHKESLGGSWHAGGCGSDRKMESSYKCAFKEGMANYGGSVGNNHLEQWEIPLDTGPVPAKNEYNVAALFTDLIDSANEDNDMTTYPAHYVFQVFKTYMANRSTRNKVSDFVWCLENRVDAAVHRSEFPGVSPPTSVSESAVEPPGWNADHIRSTWHQNVGRRR